MPQKNRDLAIQKAGGRGFKSPRVHSTHFFFRCPQFLRNIQRKPALKEMKKEKQGQAIKEKADTEKETNKGTKRKGGTQNRIHRED